MRGTLRSFFCVFTVLWTSSSGAAVSSRDFYRDIGSPVASGSLPFSELYKKRLESHRAWQYQVEAGAIKAWLKEDYLISPDSFTYRNTKVMTAITLEPITLVSGKIHVPLKEYTSLNLYSITGTSAMVYYGGRYYNTHADHLLTAIDMGSKIKTKNGQWYDYDYRKADLIFTRQGRAIEWSDIVDFQMSPNLAVIKIHLSDPKTRDRLFFKQQRVRIKEQKSELWVSSRISEHGDVWWKWQDRDDTPQFISSTDLEQKGLHALARSQRNKNMALASSNGVYFTTDGKNWRKIEIFRDENHSLAISAENTLLVGSKYSTDYGRSFHDYLSWETVTQRAESILGHPPLYMRLKKISLPTQSHRHIDVQIDTGYKHINFITSISNPKITPSPIP